MKANKIIADELVRSLKNDFNDWVFNTYTADNKKLNIRIWTSNVPILNISVYEPSTVNFNIFDKIRIYNALKQCSCLKIINLLKETK